MSMPKRNSGPIVGWFGGGKGRRSAGDASREAAEWQHIVDHEHTLAGWIWEINHSSSPGALDELARRPDYGLLIWQMIKDGWELRIRALQRLAGPLTVPDPRAQSAFSTRQILRAALQCLDNPSGYRVSYYMVASDTGLGDWRDQLQQDHRIPALFSWIWAVAGQARFFYDLEAPARYYWPVEGIPKNPRMATLQAAMCLADLVHGWGTYSSPGFPGRVILPPYSQYDRASDVPIHAFMRSFLALGNDCPPHWTCACNHVNWNIRHAAQAAAYRAQADMPNTDLLGPFAPTPYNAPGQQRRQSAPPQAPPAAPSHPSGPVTGSHRAVQRAQVTPLLPPLPEMPDEYWPDGDDDDTGEPHDEH